MKEQVNLKVDRRSPGGGVVSRWIALLSWIAFLYETVQFFNGVVSFAEAWPYYAITVVLAVLASMLSLVN